MLRCRHLRIFSQKRIINLQELDTMPYQHWLKDLGLMNWRKEGGFLIKSALVKKLKEEGLNSFCITQRDRIRNKRTE